MKKLISFALSCAMILSLAACGKGETQSGGSQGGGAQASSGSGSQTVTALFWPSPRRPKDTKLPPENLLSAPTANVRILS